MTEVTRLAAAALAVREALSKLPVDGAGTVDSSDMGLVVRIEIVGEHVKTIEQVVADIEKRYGVPIKLEWR